MIEKKKILITGASGMVGKALVKNLLKRGDNELVFLTRNREKFKKRFNWPGEVIEWDIQSQKIKSLLPSDIQAVIHLAGESIAGGRWNEKQKKKIYRSRIDGTRLLVTELIKHGPSLKVFIAASAIGIYGTDCSSQGQLQPWEESKKTGEDFLAKVCKDWEQESSDIEGISRRVLIRTGIVLDREEGALPKMLLPFRLGIGGRIGGGRQGMSWIHIDDLIRIYLEALDNDSMRGTYNAVAPHPVSNQLFTKILAKVLNKPALLTVPKTMLKIILGEMAVLVVSGQYISAKKLQKVGFKFDNPYLMDALQNLVGHMGRGEEKLSFFQWIPADQKKVFDFFSLAENLEELTPSSLRFKILKKSTPKIQQGTLIDYRLKVKGIPCHWKTLIAQFVPSRYFVDEQLKGPYKKWVHRHQFFVIDQHCLMEDNIDYKLPLGFLGWLLAHKFVKKDIQKIFRYRHQVISQEFNYESQ